MIVKEKSNACIETYDRMNDGQTKSKRILFFPVLRIKRKPHSLLVRFSPCVFGMSKRYISCMVVVVKRGKMMCHGHCHSMGNGCGTKIFHSGDYGERERVCCEKCVRRIIVVNDVGKSVEYFIFATVRRTMYRSVCTPSAHIYIYIYQCRLQRRVFRSPSLLSSSSAALRRFVNAKRSCIEFVCVAQRLLFHI